MRIGTEYEEERATSMKGRPMMKLGLSYASSSVEAAPPLRQFSKSEELTVHCDAMDGNSWLEQRKRIRSHLNGLSVSNCLVVSHVSTKR